MTQPKLLANMAIADGNTSAASSSITPSTADPPNKRLVARWLVDENSKLYC